MRPSHLRQTIIPDMNIKQKIQDILLEQFSGLQAIYLFGSLSVHTEHARSDVDIAVLLTPEQSRRTSVESFHSVQIRLEKSLSQDVDLINLRQVNTVMQKEVVTSGERIHCSEEEAAEEFEMLVFSAYQKLSQERAEIVQNIVQSGRILAS